MSGNILTGHLSGRENRMTELQHYRSCWSRLRASLGTILPAHATGHGTNDVDAHLQNNEGSKYAWP